MLGKLFQIGLFFLLLSCTNNGKIQKQNKVETLLDKLTTKNDIELYIRKKDTFYKKYKLKNIPQTYPARNSTEFLALAKKNNIINSFEKADFDGNGYTDLLAIGDNQDCIQVDLKDTLSEISCGYDPIVIMNFPKNKSLIYPLANNFKDILPKVLHFNGGDFLKLYQTEYHGILEKYINLNKKSDLEKKLTYKFNGFIEYNPSPKHHKIEKIDYLTSMCYGTCPIFNLTLARNSNFEFFAERFNFTEDREWKKEPEGYFKSSFSKNDFDELCAILNYNDFSNLNDYYTVSWTDDQTSILIITYDGGKTKMIRDYGLQGTFGLQLVYKKLFDLRTKLKWQKTTKFPTLNFIKITVDAAVRKQKQKK